MPSPAISKEVQELITLNRRIGDAERTPSGPNLELLRNVLSDNLRFRRANGSIVDKAVYLHDLTKPENTTEELRSIDIVPTIYGNLAAIEVLVAMKGVRSGNKFDGVFRNVRIFLDEPEKQPHWQLHFWFNVRVPETE